MAVTSSRSIVALLVGALVSAGLLSYIFSSISLSDVMNLIRQSDRGAVAAFLVASFGTTLLRTWRYRLMLRCVGYETPLPSMFFVVLVRNTFSDLLPARLGTLIYVFLIKSRLGVPLSSGGATFALALLLDTVGILPLIIVCAFLSSGEAASLVTAACILAAIAALLFFYLPRLLVACSSLIERSSLIPSAYRHSLGRLVSESGERLRTIETSGVWGRLLTLSVLIRFGKYVGLYLFLLALLAPRGYSMATLPFPSVFFGLCASEFAASLPFIAGLGGFGAYQGAWIATFSLLGFPLELATATSLGHHLFTQAYGYSLGAAAFLLLSLPLFMRPESSPNPASRPEHPLSFGAKCIVFVGALWALMAACLTWM